MGINISSGIIIAVFNSGIRIPAREIGMRKTIFIMATALLIVNLCAPAWSFDWGRGRGGPHGQETDVTVAAALELTSEQAAQIRTLRQAHLADVGPLRDRIWTKRQELRALWLEMSPDREKIEAAQSELNKLRTQMHEKRLGYYRAVMAILTPEQQEKLRSVVQEQPLRHGPRRGMGHRGPP